MSTNETDTIRELNLDELESVSGGAQYPTSHPDGMNP